MSNTAAAAPFGGRGYVSTAEAGAFLGVTSQTVRRLIETGELPGRRVGHLWRVPVSALVEDDAAA